MKSRRELVVYTKADCPLCDEGIREVERLALRHRLELRKVDIAGDADLFYRHRLRIPVVEYAGREIGWGRLDAATLESGLASLLGSS